MENAESRAAVGAAGPETGPAEPTAVRGLGYALDGIAAFALFALMAVTCVDVFGRYLLNRPLTGSTELTELAVGAVIFAAFPAVTWRGQHIVVDILDRFVSPTVHRIRSLAYQLVAAVGLGFIGHRIFVLAERSMRHGEVTEFLGIPVGWMIYFFAGMCWVTGVVVLVCLVKGLLTPP